MTPRVRSVCAATAALVLFAAAPAGAQTVAAVEAAYTDWMAKHKIKSGVLTLAYQQHVVLTKGYGRTDPNTPVRLASLSKGKQGIAWFTQAEPGPPAAAMEELRLAVNKAARAVKEWS